jgi:phosphoribosylanthranilate isomerase
MSACIKICGLTAPEAVDAAAQADFVGVIFHPASPRFISPAQAASLILHAKPKVVAVAVDPSDEMLREIFAAFTPSYIQLHGSETPERAAQIKERFKTPVIKAFRVSTGDDIATAHAYEKVADMLLFDAKAPKGLPGGTGLTFDWNLLAHRHFEKPWFLSGGLNVDNVEQAMHISSAEMVDVSSSLESSPGVKDPALVRSFIAQVKSITA